jgi:hypothetical protein
LFSTHGVLLLLSLFWNAKMPGLLLVAQNTQATGLHPGGNSGVRQARGILGLLVTKDQPQTNNLK